MPFIPSIMVELWLPVQGWEGAYEVSNHGRVRSLDRIVSISKSPVPGYPLQQRWPGKILRTPASKNGYPMVSFTRMGGVHQYRYVHELVATAFHGPRPPNLEVCHYDGVRTNCCAWNLRWDTRKENSHDRFRHGTVRPPKGEAAVAAKLTEDNVVWIRSQPKTTPARVMAETLKVAVSTIYGAGHGHTWAHLESQPFQRTGGRGGRR